MITGLGFGLQDTGLSLGLEENWPWPRTYCPRTHPWSEHKLALYVVYDSMLLLLLKI